MTTINRRILVVDDDMAIWASYKAILQPTCPDSESPLEKLKTALHPQGVESSAMDSYVFDLSYAAQGEQGLQLVKEANERGTPFNLAFIDVRMPPGWDGMETARRIRSLDSDIEIVIVSAYSDRSSTEITRSVGSPHKLLFFRKPFDPDELKQLAISLTDKHHIAQKEDTQRKKLEVLLNSSSAAIFTVNSQNILITWNRAAERITGYMADEVIGKPLILDTIADKSSELLGRKLQETHGSIYDRHIMIQDKGGRSRIISLNLETIPGKVQNKQETIGSFWDITMLKKTEEALTEVNLELQKQIEEKDQLQENQLRLERKLNQAQKMEAIGLMAGGVAHDLNNILSGIVGYPDILLMELPKNSKLQNTVKEIKDSGKRAAAVVADLLTVARGVAVEKKVIDLNKLIAEHLESAEGKLLKINFPKVVITTNLTAQNTPIFCSPVHIKKCLMNLLNNAAEALSTSYDINIITGIENVSGRNSSDFDLEKGEYVTLSVEDNGPGISPQAIKHIFEPFFTSKKIGRSGTGLGLAVVWNTVKDHDGAIVVNSDKSGTVFKMMFPMSKKKVHQDKEPRELKSLHGDASILVVDDEAMQRKITENLLTKLGYNVVALGSGEEAISHLKNNTMDLILLDMIMHPGIDGLQTYAEIVKIHPSQKAIITSGYSGRKEILRAKELGVNEFISKPYTIEQLGLIIKQVLHPS